MRKSLAEALLARARTDERILLIVGDIGFGVFDEFRRQFPKRFLNTGIAEQAMVGFASGLAKEGYRPIVYTIAPFLIGRAYDQVRVDVAMHSRHMLLVGVGGGVSYGKLGPTHHSLDDLALASLIPDLRVCNPSSPARVSVWIDRWLDNSVSPMFMRIGRDEPHVSQTIVDDGAIVGFPRQQNAATALLVSGSLLTWAQGLVESLSHDEVPPAVYAVEEIEPFPHRRIAELLQGHKRVVVAEEAYATGGLFSRVASVALSQVPRDSLPELYSYSMEKRFYFEVADASSLLRAGGLTSDSILDVLLGRRNG